MNDDELREQLRRHLGFLERSARDYDAGHADEAIRMAVSMRVLFHDTNASTSLLSLLLASSAQVLSTVQDLDASYVVSAGNLSVARMAINNTSSSLMVTASFEPRLDRPGPRAYKPWKEWWNQVVMVSGAIRVTRRDIVLAAVNKDGGAHVDKVPAFYKGMMAGGGYAISAGDGPNVKMSNLQLCDLRQMGHEVLASHDLTDLL